MKKILILFVIAFTINANAQESALLRLNYKKGDSYVVNMKMSQDIGDAISMDMNMKMSMNITSVSSKGYVSKMKIASMAMDMNQGGMNMSFDSSKSDDELDQMGLMLKSQMAPMLQVVITAKGNSLGEVTETTVEPNTPGVSDFANQTGGVVYPEKSVRIGDTWTMNKSDKGMSIKSTYTVKSITNKIVIVAVAGEVSGSGSGNVTGTMSIDRKTGIPLTSVIDMNVEAGGQTIISKTTVTTTKK